jgi:hypothetical protein
MVHAQANAEIASVGSPALYVVQEGYAVDPRGTRLPEGLRREKPGQDSRPSMNIGNAFQQLLSAMVKAHANRLGGSPQALGASMSLPVGLQINDGYGAATQSASTKTNPLVQKLTAAISPRTPGLSTQANSPFSTGTTAGANLGTAGLSKKDLRTFSKYLPRFNTLQAKFGAATPGASTASAKVSPVSLTQSADAASPANLQLTGQEVAAIRAAATPEEAALIVRGAMARKAGLPQAASGDMSNVLSGANRQIASNLLGFNIRNGPFKNMVSSNLLDQMISTTVNAVRSAPASSGLTTQAADELGGLLPGEDCDCEDLPPGLTPITNPGTSGTAEPLNVNLSEFLPDAKNTSSLASPLVMDLEGTGLKIRHAHLVAVDVDGDGQREVVTDLEPSMGLLLFNADGSELAGAFGDNTDLSAYGVETPVEGFADGFAALRALCEHLGLVKGRGAMSLDADAIAFLEREVGLRVRLGGVRGEDERSLTELGITRFDLGDERHVDLLSLSEKDAFGNRMMRQRGATFVIQGQVREYADLWFNVQARLVATRDAGQPSAAATL